MTGPEITYEVKTRNERLRIRVPADWKVTFGPVSPGSKFGGSGELALRFYESDTKQRAIFTDVISFRDLSIPVQRLVKKASGSEEWTQDENGEERKSRTKIDREWKAE
jgi:hypothetical protein